MAKHILSLEVLDTLNQAIFRITDLSVYAENVPVDCPTLEVTLPGFAYSVKFESDRVVPGFALNLTACDFGIQKSNCGTQFANLPDGIYILKYSVSPNDTIFAEYNYLRLSNIMNHYQRILCDLDISGCAPEKDRVDRLEELRLVKMYLEAAKAKVEICHEPKKGMELYSYAKKILSKFDCQNCH